VHVNKRYLFFCVKKVRCLKLISWKYSFKRLSEEYEIANKKKKALDNLFETGKISQATRDSFNEDINTAIVEIEKQQKALVDKMQSKTQELQDQIKTLEILLANYEIQYVVGEIEDETYKREISLLSTGLESTKNELDVIKQATSQLCTPIQLPASPVVPELVAPAIENEVAQTAPVEIIAPEIAPAEAAPVETVTVEPMPVENIIVEPVPEPAPLETIPIEVPVQTVSAEISPVEAAPAEAATMEVAPAPIETAPVETPVVETLPVENIPVESASVEALPVEATPAEVIPAETAPVTLAEPEVQINESVPEIAPQELIITEPAPQELIINMEEAAPVEAPTETAAPTEEVAEAIPEQPAVEIPLQDFEVTEQAPVETTLEKVIEPIIEPLIESITVEESQIPAHPLEAPSQAQTETANEQSAETAETEDSSEESE
jgi:hypothetical protein